MDAPSTALSPRGSAGAGLRRLVTYGLVGLVSNGVAFGVYVVLADLVGLPPTISMTLVYATAATVGFWGNRHLTFGHEGAVLGSLVRYLLTYGLGYLLNLAILLVLVDHLGYSHIWVQAGAVVVVAAFLFVMLGRFVFPAATRAAAEHPAPAQNPAPR